MFNLFQQQKTAHTNESYTQLKCPKCNKTFEPENLAQGSRYQVTCPACNEKIIHKTKLTDVTLSANYTTFIDSNKDLIIQKRLKSFNEIGAAFIGLVCCLIAVLHTISRTDSFLLLILWIYAIISIPIGVCGLIDSLFNTREIRVGSNFLQIFIRPYPLFRKDHFYTSDEIEQIYCKAYQVKNGYYYNLLAIMKNGKKITLIKQFSNLEEARGLEILIEKRLGIQDRPVEDEELHELNMITFK